MESKSASRAKRTPTSRFIWVLPAYLLLLLGITLPLISYGIPTGGESRLLASYDFSSGSYPASTSGTASFSLQGSYYLHFEEVGEHLTIGGISPHDRLEVRIAIDGFIAVGPASLISDDPLFRIEARDEDDIIGQSIAVSKDAGIGIVSIAFEIATYASIRIAMANYAHDIGNPLAALSILVSRVDLYDIGA